MSILPTRWHVQIPGLIALVLLGAVLPLAAADKRKAEKPASTIFVIRGGGGYFPNLGTVINQKFEDQGLEVVDYRYHQRAQAAKQIAEAYRRKELPHGIILIGYSLGGCGVIDVSKSLQKEGIPVRLLFLIETINPLQTVPANVQECFNLYHFPAILGAPVKADSPQTKLTNFEAYSDGKLGLEYSHFAMPFVEEVHELIASRLVAAIEAKPSRKSASPAESASPGKPTPRIKSASPASPAKPAPLASRKKGPGEEVPASDTSAKRPAFSGLFARPRNAAKDAERDPAKASPDKPAGAGKR